MSLKKMACFAGVCCLFASSLLAADALEKIYLPKEAIELADEGIYIRLEGKQIGVELIGYDDNGYYILSSGNLMEKKFMAEMLPYCERHQMYYETHCPDCRREERHKNKKK